MMTLIFRRWMTNLACENGCAINTRICKSSVDETIRRTSSAHRGAYVVNEISHPAALYLIEFER